MIKMSMQPYQLITRYIHDLPERERERKKPPRLTILYNYSNGMPHLTAENYQ